MTHQTSWLTMKPMFKNTNKYLAVHKEVNKPIYQLKYACFSSRTVANEI